MAFFSFRKKEKANVERRDLEAKIESLAQALLYGGMFTNNGSLSLSAVYSALEIISNSIA